MISALLEFAFVVLLSRAPSIAKKTCHDDTVEKRAHSIAERLRRRKIATEANCTVDRCEMDKKQVKEQSSIKGIFNIPPIHVVDLLSFVLYIFFFIAFNAVYWINYQLV